MHCPPVSVPTAVIAVWNEGLIAKELKEVSWFSVKWKIGALALASRSNDKFS
jgi:hypothetical protein